MYRRLLISGSFALVVSAVACAGSPRALPDIQLADNAPVDRPLAVVDSTAADRLHAALEPCRVRAMAAFPDVRSRFLRGLPSRQSLFVITRLRDAARRTEQVFVAVDSIRPDSIIGRLASNIGTVVGYRSGQRLAVAEDDVVDWMISRPDGSEEGNLMGKFIDAWQARGSRPTEMCAGEA